MSEIILILLIILTLLTIFCLYKFLNKRGLYFALVILNLITFVLAFKISYVFKMNINVCIVPYIATLSVIYFFVIKYGYKEIKNLLLVSLYTNVSASILLAITNFLVPAITETVSINMRGTFEHNYKILIVYPIIMVLSQYIVIKLYKLISSIHPNIPLCIMITYIITAIAYTIVFYLLSYIITLDFKSSLFLGVSTYIIGLVITILNIVFITCIMNNKKVVK